MRFLPLVRSLALVLLLGPGSSGVMMPAGQTAPAAATETASPRLLATARLWVTVKYFHPFLADRGDIDWDQALVAALPKITAARNPADYRAAVESMLAVLRDPETHARLAGSAGQPDEAAQIPASGVKDVLSTSLVLLDNDRQFSVGAGRAASASPQILDEAAQALAGGFGSAGRASIDLRRSPGHDPRLLAALLDREDVRGRLLRKPLAGAAQRSWMHAGLPPEAGGNPYGYYSAFLTRQAPGFSAGGPDAALTPGPQSIPAGGPLKIRFRVSEGSVLPEIGAALVAARLADLEADSGDFTIAGVRTASIPMGQGVTATVRLSEGLAADGTAIDAAHTPLAAVPAPRPPQFDPALRYPSPELRLLAAFKTWGALKYFFAYPDQMDEDWDSIFARSLPTIENARDAREYQLAIASLIGHLNDSQADVESAELEDYFGAAPPPLRLRLVDQRPVVAQILDESARAAGIAIGDIVLKVDGEDIAERTNRLTAYLSASTQQSLGLRVMGRVLNGAEGSAASLVLRGAGGVQKEVKLERRRAYLAGSTPPAMSRPWRAGPVFKMLDGNTGYADLERLAAPQVDEMFRMFQTAKGVILDLRGVPRDRAAVSEVASRLARSAEAPAALVNWPLVLEPAVPRAGIASSNASYFEVRTLSQSGAAGFRGKTVMLADERTAAEAEQAALLLEAANHTVCIGSPSAGSNGEPTNLLLPGGITVSFSGHDIRHATSGQLQRLGLQPEVLVKPSIQGIRQGRDEVLEKALAYLAQ